MFEKRKYWKELLGGAMLMLIITLGWQICKRKTEPASAFVLARVIKLDTLQGANFVAFQYWFMDSSRTAIVPMSYFKTKPGDLYFVQEWKDSPGKVGFDPHNIVPDCFDKTSVPTDGWKKIPSCN